MKKLLTFAAVMALSLGCAVTNYSLITDNDVGGTVGTNGKAYIKQSAQIAFQYPDGTDNLIWFVDQATGSGNRTLYTIDFHRDYPAQSPFKDDLYCSPDWSGCAIVTAPDPEVGDTSIFDNSQNQNCTGWRTLSLLTSTSRYYGECGRAKGDRIRTVLNLANQMTPVSVNGTTWLKGVVNSSNLTYIVDNNNGMTTSFSPGADVTLLVNAPHHQIQMDLQNPVIRQSLQRARTWLDAHPGPYQTITAVLNGETATGNVKVLTGPMGNFIEQHY
jgi:hypothetical protein